MKRIKWPVVGCLMVLSLLLGSSALPAAAPGPEMVKLSLTKVDGTKVEKTVEKPKYGGTFVGALDRPYLTFDYGAGGGGNNWPVHLTNEEMLIGDWTRSGEGTGEASFQIRGHLFMDFSVGSLAESWEINAPDTIIYHIRKGVHWHDKPPVNGRELTAEDVVSSFNRLFSLPKSTLYASRQYFKSATALDKWTVMLKSKEGAVGMLFRLTCDYGIITAPEVIEEYEFARDPKSVIGTGPFILQELVPGSSVTLVRNPDYWGHDPLHPQNQLPYLDAVQWLVIQDVSTRIAALRTAKIDWINTVGWEEAEDLRKTNPELQEFKFLQAAHDNIIWMRLDKPELPFHDIRVRKALAMAIDRQEIAKHYYGGNAELLTCPVAPYPELINMYTPLAQLPATTREIFAYNPEKAKQLLAEAGYPNGFKTRIVCAAEKGNILSIVKANWASVGVEIDIDVREHSVWSSMRSKRTHNEMIMATLASVAPYSIPWSNPRSYQNSAMLDNPRANELRDFIASNMVIHDDVILPKLKEFFIWSLDQVWWIETPDPYLWVMWQPYVKGYHGEKGVGFNNWYNFPKYIWYDQDLKRR